MPAATPSRQEPQETVAETPQWITKNEAAKLLCLSPQRVLAMAAAGQIQSKIERDPVSKQIVKMLHAGDVAKVLWRREHPDETPAKPAQAESPDKSLAVVPAPQTEAIANALVERLLNPPAPALVTPAPKPWLTLAAASEFSGLTRRWLLGQTKMIAPKIGILDMGKGARGGQWRFSRADLEKGC
jgi:hypothetical protein